MDARASYAAAESSVLRRYGTKGKASECPVRDVMQTLSGKWSSLLVMALAERPYRFGELRRLVPDISQRMLTQTLGDLQRDGYVHRRVFSTRPPMVEYSLSELGHSMYARLSQVLDWAEANHAAVREARSAFDAAQANGLAA